MGLSSFNRARERQQMTETKIAELEEQLATLKGEFIAFQNDPEAMKARIAELELGQVNKTLKVTTSKLKTTKTQVMTRCNQLTMQV